MKTKLFVLLAMAFLSTINSQLSTLFAQGTAFTYQGRLTAGTNVANGFFDITFSVWTNVNGAAQVGNTLTNPATVVSNGLLTAVLDFDNVFPGADRWLEIGVRSNGVGGFSLLSPRQKITAMPYAITAGTVSGNIPAGQITGTVPPDALSNAWKLAGNSATTPGTHFLGTADNQPLEFKVNNERALRLEPNGISPNVVGGYIGNSVGSGSKGAVIAGGGASGSVNTIGGNSDRSAIGGGEGNQITDNVARAVIAGGANNQIGPDGAWATISGGRNNAIGPNGDQSVIGGGALHSIQGLWSVIGGGLQNTNDLFSDQNVIGGGKLNYIGGGATWSVISGGQQNAIANDADFAMVPGGLLNAVAGKYGLAAGRRAKANHQGTFVWADSTDADFASSANNQFLIRASGGVAIGANDPAGAALRVVGNIKADALLGGGTALVVGTTGSQPVEFKVNTQRVLRLEDNGDSISDGDAIPDGAPNVIGGSQLNFVSAGIVGVTIAGGGATNWNGVASTNAVRADFGTISGGSGNLIAGSAYFGTIGGGGDHDIGVNSDSSTVGGGFNNNVGGNSANATIGGGQNNAANGPRATVGGGAGNTAVDDATVGGGSGNSASHVATTVAGGAGNSASQQRATVGGGFQNSASGHTSTVGGGQDNIASGLYATIPGGVNNAAANQAFAAGSHAKANHSGTFVWSDATGVDFASTTNNQFLVRATGNVGINTNNPQSTLHVNGQIAANSLRAPGAGINTGTFAFTHRVTAGNINAHRTTIVNSLCDGDPDAILLVTHNWSKDTSASQYHTQVVGVFYNGGNWEIFHEDNATVMEVGDAFNVMVIKP